MRCCQILTSCLCTHWPLRSYYRCFTIHATNNLLLQNNVGFHASGHCFYIEVGCKGEQHTG